MTSQKRWTSISFIYWSAGEEWQELGEELAGVLGVGDVPAFRYDHPGGAGNITSGRGGKLGEVTEPGGVLRLRILAKRDDVIRGPDDQQCRRRDQVIFVADRLLVDHLESQCRSPGPPRVVRAQGHPDQDVGLRLPDFRVGMHEVSFDAAADHGRVGPVHFVLIERFLRLRRDAYPVIGQAERVFQDQVGDPAVGATTRSRSAPR
jgi:hypothetical protein